MNKAIPYGRQNITEEDIQAVVEVLKSDYLTQGPKIEEFEKAFAIYIGAKYAVAVANGTAALHLSTMAIGIKPGDKVITTPNTFVASANCVRYCGGEVYFADINPETYLLDIDKVKELLESYPKGAFKGIIPVDFAGYPVNLEAFRKLADEYGLWIIEDACHAPGGYFTDSNGKRQMCGNGNYADLAIFSFHPVKHIATGEGGMITTNNEELYKKLLLLRTHGITKDSSFFQNSIETAIGNQLSSPNSQLPTYPNWYYEMQELGFNYRLTEMQAALGISQLKKINSSLIRRNEIVTIYNEAFKDENIITPAVTADTYHAFHLYIIQTEKRLELYSHLRKNNIFAQVHYVPIFYQPYYKRLENTTYYNLQNTERYYNNCLSLPMFPSLKEEEQYYVIHTIRTFFKHGKLSNNTCTRGK